MASAPKSTHPLVEKLQKSGSLSAQELEALQSHIDQLEKAAAGHADTVQSSHFHPSAMLEAGSGRPSE